MPKAPRPTDPKGMKAWAAQNWPSDPARQARELQAGMKAGAAAKAAAEKNKADMARRAANERKAKRGY